MFCGVAASVYLTLASLCLTGLNQFGGCGLWCVHGRNNDSGLPKVAMRWEIIVVDDGSSDATALICDELKAQHSEVEVIRHEQNRGYGAVLKSGMMSAKYDLIFFSDELCPLLRKLRHVALNQTRLYSATDKAQTTPILTDDAIKGSSQELSLDNEAITVRLSRNRVVTCIACLVSNPRATQSCVPLPEKHGDGSC